MNRSVIPLVILVLSLGMAPALQSGMIPDADAVKAKGVYQTVINSKKICGDKFCPVVSEKSYTPPKSYSAKKGLFPSAMDYTVKGPVIDPAKGYALVEIGSDLYLLTDGEYQAMFLTTGEGVILIDAPARMGEKIQQAISDVTTEKVTHVIYSHIHKDHLGSASLFAKDATYIGHADAAAHLKMKNDPQRPVPTVTFDDSYTLNVGDQTLELSYIGPFHSKGDIVVYSPAHKVLMVVDFFRPNVAPFQFFTLASNMGEHLVTHDKLLAMDFEIMVTGHDPILATPEHLTFYKQFTLDVLDNAQTAIDTVEEDEDYFYNLTNTCAELTVQQHSDLKNINDYPVQNCLTMIFYALFG